MHSILSGSDCPQSDTSSARGGEYPWFSRYPDLLGRIAQVQSLAEELAIDACDHRFPVAGRNVPVDQQYIAFTDVGLILPATLPDTNSDIIWYNLTFDLSSIFRRLPLKPLFIVYYVK